MKIVTLRGTWEIDLSEMKVLRPGDMNQIALSGVPSPVIGERMSLETEYGKVSTEPVMKVES